MGGFVAVWNLRHDYDAEGLRKDLYEVDFEPDVVKRFADIDGAFALVFREEYKAAAMALALDDIDPCKGILKDSGDRIRVAQWSAGAAEHWSDENVPAQVKTVMSELHPQLLRDWATQKL